MDLPLLNNFKAKVIITNILVTVCSLGLLSFLLEREIENKYLDGIKESLRAQSLLISKMLPLGSLKSNDYMTAQKYLESYRGPKSPRVTVIDNSGKVLADTSKSIEEITSMENHIERPEFKSALSGFEGISLRYSDTLKISMLYIALPIKENNSLIGAVRTAMPIKDINIILLETRKRILLVFFISLLLGILLANLLSYQTINTIKSMIDISRYYSKGDFTKKMLIIPKDEIGELARNLNIMGQKIESQLKEIKAQKQKLEAMFNSMNEGVIVTDEKATVLSFNKQIENTFPVKHQESVGKNLLETIRNIEIYEIVRKTINYTEPISAEVTLVYPSQKTFKINSTPILENNSIAGCLVVIHDISELRRIENIRKEFIANVSHELKTPLTSIKGYVETLLDGAINDKENNRRFLEIMRGESDRLESLINDILSLSSIESKEMKPDKTAFELSQILRELLPSFEARLKGKSIILNNYIEKRLTVIADKKQLSQVFINLIDNAIKFNKNNGSIDIKSRDMMTSIEISISDTGLGIPNKDITRIFERFYRVDKARSREMGGTGLGLSIVKHIIDGHNGTLRVESTEGLGSTFFFTLPK
ncbi:MAG: PAS domain S-box protein [Candidatus Omnitrophica bacterium]|nr:PAS domain S-box protein [Candidatus Omnitrophota bacterium]